MAPDFLRLVLFLPVFVQFCAAQSLGQGNLKCYSCNVKMGVTEATQCHKRWVVEKGCVSCMKIDVVMYQSYRKPRWYPPQYRTLNFTSRICVDNENAPRWSNTCFWRWGNSGWIRRCYCETDRCNGAGTLGAGLVVGLVCILVATVVGGSRVTPWVV